MIIREIINYPVLLDDDFDFFNNYKDTKRWLEVQLSNTQYVLDKLEDAYQEKHINKSKQGE